MCGIICEICFAESQNTLDTNILLRIKNRGPDCVQSTEVKTNEGARIFFYGAVLWMQGSQLTPQPVENDSGILLYNGDIFDASWNDRISDTLTIMNKLTCRIEESAEQHIIKELKSLKGPFSIIYYDKNTQDLYFTRDRIGRNSLLFDKTESSVIISNVLGRKSKCVEVPATHLYILSLKSRKVKLYSWTSNAAEEYLLEHLYDSFLMQQNTSDEDYTFSTNIDIDLNDEENVVEYMEYTAHTGENNFNIMEKLLAHCTIKNTVDRITELLEKSVEIRLKRQPNRCKECLFDREVTCSHATVGVLFSGGLDCTILAYLADKYISKEQFIDLINVAFKKDAAVSYDVPDRITGRQSFEELRRLCPSRKWNFIEVNVPQEELLEYQMNTIADLVFPRKTILDESLGSALWFASRAKIGDSVSPCRVLLVGSGADELFGGYKRHYNAFKRQSWSGLSTELLRDWHRISFRNLARDNRVICDHGRQPRMPYLDENLTNFVLQLKPWLKCFPSDAFGVGVGEKLMLRLVAYNIGLRDVITLPKRALQFGSRIANKKEKGSDLSIRFLST